MENKKEFTGKNDGCTSSTFDSRDVFDDDFKNVKDIHDLKNLFDKMNKVNAEYDAQIRNAMKSRARWTGNPKVEYACTIWLTSSDVKKNYPICTNTLRKYRTNNKIPFTFQNGKYLYKKEDIEAFFEENYNGKKKIKTKVA